MTSGQPDRHPSTLILGLGNTLMTDEAAGILVVRRLETEGRLPDAVLLDGGTLSFTLAGPIADCPRLIVVDAAAMGTAPGTVRVFEGPAMDRQLSGRGRSVHEVGLMELMDMARLTDTFPERRALIGIEPARVEWGDGLTAEVSEAIPRAMQAVYSLMEAWESAAPQTV
jgi:hydrogenase maturation protease